MAQTELFNQHILGQQLLIITDSKIAELYLTDFLSNFTEKQADVLLLEPGEKNKNVIQWASIFDQLLEKKHLRSTTLIALGGGVIGDITGFAAACYQRGVSFLQVPTTLLAQVDASIGGKTAINYRGSKNMIGAFYPPKAVFIDIQLLKTLSKRELAAGWAEIIKHALIYDAEFFCWLEQQQLALQVVNEALYLIAIKRACKIKAEIVSQDEYEHGKRALLNFGHTFGHALESISQHDLLHGEAVAIGMIMACKLSVYLGYLSSETLIRVKRLISTFSLPIEAQIKFDLSDLLQQMQYDKKNTDVGLKLILLERIGAAKIVQGVSATQILTALEQS